MKPFNFLLVFILFPLFSSAQGIATTVAGDGTIGIGGENVVATSNPMTWIAYRVAVDDEGNVYYSDSCRVRKVDAATGLVSTIAGGMSMGFSGDGGPAINAELRIVIDVEIGPDGHLYICDQMNNRVRKVDLGTGIITTVAGSGSSTYNGDNIAATTAAIRLPTAVTFDKEGNMLVCDDNNRVRKIDQNGIITTIAGTGASDHNGDAGQATNAAVGSPSGVCVDTAGNIYIASFWDNRIRKITKQTGVISTIDFMPYFFTTAEPVDITADDFGHVYFPESNFDKVIARLEPNGAITIMTDGPHHYNGENIPADTMGMMYATGITTDRCGNIFIMDREDHRIRKIEYQECWPASVQGAEKENGALRVYPNPASSSVTISSSEKIVALTVTDVTGRIVLQRTVNSEQVIVDVSGLGSGVYFLRAGGEVVKVVKE